MREKTLSISLGLLLSLSLPRPARADGSLAYKFEDYAEDGGRVGVHTQGVTASQDLDSESKFTLTAITDSIAGATPTGLPAPAGSNQVPLAHLADHRKSWDASLQRQFGRESLTLEYSQSREHDYVSRGWALNSLTDFFDKNTSVLAGLSGHSDQVETFYDPQHLYVGKQAFSAILGVTQLLDPLTRVSLNVTWARETGYLSDQYKLVTQSIEVIPGTYFPLVYAENRPSEHNSGVAYASINRALPSLNAALQASYRLYSDTYGVVANSVEAEWLQKIGRTVTVSPMVRLYEQSAAKFYYYDLTKTDLAPTFTPDPSGPAYSSDYRLSSLDTVTVGLKLDYKPREWLHLDVAYDRYAMHGRDGVTPQSAYPNANITTVGAAFTW